MIDEKLYDENSIKSYNYDNIEDIPLINAIRITKSLFGRIDVIINNYYNGDMKYKYLLLDFNKIDDITEMKVGMIFKLPEVSFLEEQITLNNILDTEEIPGVLSSTDNISLNDEMKNKLSIDTVLSIPKLKIKPKTAEYIPETGIIKY